MQSAPRPVQTQLTPRLLLSSRLPVPSDPSLDSSLHGLLLPCRAQAHRQIATACTLVRNQATRVRRHRPALIL